MVLNDGRIFTAVLNKYFLHTFSIVFIFLLQLLLSFSANGKVVINEVMMNPLPDSTNSQFQSMFSCSNTAFGSEWIEIFNDSKCDTVYLDCFILSARISGTNSGSFAFPAGTQIAPLSFILIGGANVTGADFRLPDFCSSDTMCGTVWSLGNDMGYVALYNSSGAVEDAVFWTPGPGTPALLTSDPAFDNIPCVPARCVINGNLKKANEMTPGAEISYAGGSPAQGLTIHRTVDGIGGWQRNATPTPRACNGVCRPQSDLSAFIDSMANETCKLQNGFLSAFATGGIAPYSYEWNVDDRDSFITNLSEGIYTITVTDFEGCKDTFTLNLPNIGNPVELAIEPPSATIYQGDSIQLLMITNANLVSIIWTPGIRLSCGNCANPIVFPNESRTYNVSVADIDGCVADTTIRIKVLPDEKSVFIPNVFTPNTDGLNDGLFVRSIRIATMDFRIFDRWGKEVFYTTDQNVPWLGTDKQGNKLSSGTYVYVLDAVFHNGKSRIFKGNITMVK
jgi:gliding motility-associated-like protein